MSLKTIKEQKITVSENSTTPSKSQNSSTKDSSRTETSPSSRLTMFQVFMMLLVLMDLTISIHVMNLMDLFREKLSQPKTHSGHPEGTCRDWPFVSDEHRPLQQSLILQGQGEHVQSVSGDHPAYRPTSTY